MPQNLSLEQQQQQRLHLTTEVRQGISVLCMNAAELSEYAAVCLDENPFLERDERWDRKYPCEAEKHRVCQSTEALVVGEQNKKVFEDDSGYAMCKEFSFDHYAAEYSTLESNLEAHLELSCSSEVDCDLGRYLIGNIDRSGYLCVEIDEVATLFEVTPKKVEQILEVVQSYHPGIGARNVQECLLLQLEVKGNTNLLTKRIVKECLSDLAFCRYQTIARFLSVSLIEVQEACDVIRRLDPRPGLQFDVSQGDIVWPEVAIVNDGGEWKVCLQEFDMPRMIINEQYLPLLKQKDIDKSTLKYLKEKLKTAEGLLQGIEQRKQTLYRVACCVAELQKDFFDQGSAALKPLTMTSIAKVLEVSESTVSRVVNGNYIQTPQGLFEMRYFFQSGVSQKSQTEISSEGVKHFIRQLVDEEDQSRPLSDTAIEKELKCRGIDISRRTVNKYRQNMGILPASKRRRYQVC